MTTSSAFAKETKTESSAATVMPFILIIVFDKSKERIDCECEFMQQRPDHFFAFSEMEIGCEERLISFFLARLRFCGNLK